MPQHLGEHSVKVSEKSHFYFLHRHYGENRTSPARDWGVDPVDFHKGGDVKNKIDIFLKLSENVLLCAVTRFQPRNTHATH